MPAVRADAKVQPDAQSLAAFFNKTCAPRATRNGPLVGGGAWEGLCTGCKVRRRPDRWPAAESER